MLLVVERRLLRLRRRHQSLDIVGAVGSATQEHRAEEGRGRLELPHSDGVDAEVGERSRLVRGDDSAVVVPHSGEMLLPLILAQRKLGRQSDAGGGDGAQLAARRRRRRLRRSERRRVSLRRLLQQSVRH